MQNPGRTRALRRRLLPFCLLHSWGRSGGGLGMVWGRPDVGRARLCYSETYEVSNVARGAPVCPVQRRRGDGVSPASP